MHANHSSLRSERIQLSGTSLNKIVSLLQKQEWTGPVRFLYLHTEDASVFQREPELRPQTFSKILKNIHRHQKRFRYNLSMQGSQALAKDYLN